MGDLGVGRPAKPADRSAGSAARPPTLAQRTRARTWSEIGKATTPSAARLASTCTVNALVIEPIRNSVSAPGASFGLSARRPKPVDSTSDRRGRRRGRAPGVLSSGTGSGRRSPTDLSSRPWLPAQGRGQGKAAPARSPRTSRRRMRSLPEKISVRRLRRSKRVAEASTTVGREERRSAGGGPRHCWTAAADVVVLIGVAEACVAVRSRVSEWAGRRPIAQSNPIPDLCRQPDRCKDGSAQTRSPACCNRRGGRGRLQPSHGNG